MIYTKELTEEQYLILTELGAFDILEMDIKDLLKNKQLAPEVYYKLFKQLFLTDSRVIAILAGDADKMRKQMIGITDFMFIIHQKYGLSYNKARKILHDTDFYNMKIFNGSKLVQPKLDEEEILDLNVLVATKNLRLNSNL